MAMTAIVNGDDYYLQKARLHIQHSSKLPEQHGECPLVILRGVILGCPLPASDNREMISFSYLHQSLLQYLIQVRHLIPC
jgi:hypothetical protein